VGSSPAKQLTGGNEVRRLSLFFAVIGALLLVAGPAQAKLPPPVKHVWTIVLENEDATTSFGPDSPAPYLATTLRQKGQFLPNYYGVTHASLGNYLAMISGQGSDPATRSDCFNYSDFMQTQSQLDSSGQAIGNGCVYPATVKTVADQLQGKGLSWRGYMEDMGNDPTRETSPCGHPALNANDKSIGASPTDQYATRHNPFVYFHSLLDSGSCANYDVSLAPLQGDLAANSVPSYTFITPDLCNDGHDATCADPTQAGGLTAVNGFLKTWIPRIQATKAYRDNGMILILFDESKTDATTCCNQPVFPNGNVSTGGGRTGAVVLSKYVKPGSQNNTPYNHFSVLRSVENTFHLGYLGYAGRPGLKAFGSDVYNACYESPAKPVSHHGRFSRGTVIASAAIHSRVLSVKMAHPAKLDGLLHSRRVLGARNAQVCRTYKFNLKPRHGTLTLRASRDHAREQRVLHF
jgi:hypothetical protein